MTAQYNVSSKIPGGKLVRVKTAVEKGNLVKPELSGDFFLMPVESLQIIERTMDGWELADLKGLERELARVIDEHRIMIAGISPAGIIEALKKLQPLPETGDKA